MAWLNRLFTITSRTQWGPKQCQLSAKHNVWSSECTPQRTLLCAHPLYFQNLITTYNKHLPPRLELLPLLVAEPHRTELLPEVVRILHEIRVIMLQQEQLLWSSLVHHRLQDLVWYTACILQSWNNTFFYYSKMLLIESRKCLQRFIQGF